jgi:hypothetical protein
MVSLVVPRVRIRGVRWKLAYDCPLIKDGATALAIRGAALACLRILLSIRSSSILSILELMRVLAARGIVLISFSAKTKLVS